MELAGAVHADSGGIAAPEKLAVATTLPMGMGALAGTAGVLKAAAVDGEHRAGVFRVLRHGVAAHVRTEHRADGDLHTHRIVDHGDVAAPALADDARYEQPRPHHRELLYSCTRSPRRPPTVWARARGLRRSARRARRKRRASYRAPRQRRSLRQGRAARTRRHTHRMQRLPATTTVSASAKTTPSAPVVFLFRLRP